MTRTMAVVTTLLLAAPVLAMPGRLTAQTAEIGVRIGRSLSSMHWDFPSCSDSCITQMQSNTERKTASYSLIARLPIHGRTSIQIEPGYVRKGYEVTGPQIHSDYLDLPLLVRQEWGTGSVRPFVQTGPSINFLLSCQTRSSEATAWSDDCDGSGRSGVTSTDLAGVIAGGATFKFGAGRVSAEARFSKSLGDVQPDVSDRRARHQVRSLSLGYEVAVR